MRKHVLSAGVCLGLFAAMPVQAKIIFSDGFESPMQNGGYSYGGTDAAGATFTGGAGLQANGSAFGYAAAPEGVQTAHIQSVESVTESVSGLTSGNVFTLSFFAAARPGYALDPFTVSYTPFSDTDPLLLTVSPTSTDWTKYSTSFTSQGDGTITFTGLRSNANGDFNVGLDAVTISTGGVPEISTWLMLLLGFCGLGAFAYRLKTTTSVAGASLIAA